MKVLAKSGKQSPMRGLTEGKTGQPPDINLAGVKVSLPALTAKDIPDVKLRSGD